MEENKNYDNMHQTVMPVIDPLTHYIEDKESWYYDLANLTRLPIKERNKRYRPKVKNFEQRFEREKNGETVVLKLRHMDVTYGHGARMNKAVKDVSFNIYKGEILGLVGESGSGKSTTGNVIAGLVQRSFGSMEVLGRAIPQRLWVQRHKHREFMINKIQMIFQDPAGSLNPHKNILNVVSEGINNLKNKKQIFEMLHIEDLLRELELLAKKVGDKRVLNESARSQIVKRLYGEDQDRFSTRAVLLNKIAPALVKDYPQLADEVKALKEDDASLWEQLQNKKYAAAQKRLIVRTLKAVGLDDTVLRRYPLEFSGGQQQRIGITRALVMRPTLLIADEPISALDVSIQAQVINIFNDLKDDYNLTMLLIAHDLRMVEYVSDRIAVMYKGRIVEIGRAADVAQRSLHPYTKSLLDAVPSLESKQGSLIGYVYDPKMHNYDENHQPEWIKVRDEHFILATPEEYENWKAGRY